jgi:hypothetical protein
MGHEAFICCYFDQENCDCVGGDIMFTLFSLNFSKFLVGSQCAG